MKIVPIRTLLLTCSLNTASVCTLPPGAKKAVQELVYFEGRASALDTFKDKATRMLLGTGTAFELLSGAYGLKVGLGKTIGACIAKDQDAARKHGADGAALLRWALGTSKRGGVNDLNRDSTNALRVPSY